MNSYISFLQEYYDDVKVNQPTVRMGQHFINCYYSGTWPELYYEKDEKKCEVMIYKFMRDNQWLNSDLQKNEPFIYERKEDSNDVLTEELKQQLLKHFNKG